MKNYVLLLLAAFILGGCASTETLTPQQQQKQQAVDAIVADALFDAGLNEKASYEVSTNGEVNILFTKDVSEEDYNQVVRKLRSDPRIPYLYAEQNGKEVCPMSSLRP